MTEELSGRPLEVAVAKALGWTCDSFYADWHDVTGPNFEFGHSGETADEAWEKGAPAYLTDPVAFASVLAALDADQVRTNILFTPHLGEAIASIIDTWNEVWDRGKTREEAMLKAFVKWKQAQS